jgi:hypothetical protein
MVNNKNKGLSVFRWLKGGKDTHRNPNFAKKYDVKKFDMNDPRHESIAQNTPLSVVTHPYLLKPWIKLHTFSSRNSMCQFHDEIKTGADIAFEKKSKLKD